jgi:hypothetical protein
MTLEHFTIGVTQDDIVILSEAKNPRIFLVSRDSTPLVKMLYYGSIFPRLQIAAPHGASMLRFPADALDPDSPANILQIGPPP